MKRIKVSFQFWQNQKSKDWDYTSLMGDDKLKVLKFFDLSKIFTKNRASIIRELWDKFYELYRMIKNPETKGENFQHHAKNWLTLFLLPSEGIPNTQGFKRGLYQPNNMTPYIHVLVYHIPEFMTIHQKWGLAAFSCSGVEKKNHQQISYFFHKTMHNNNAIMEILQHENRIIYYNNTTSVERQRPQKIHIKT